ncbi:hypothetical protein [Pseudofrankia sp. DC12]|uniref:hypothetical protein n=1 Tax=Pseudofrankia sp. DC12 TaxID=683315 RepID=UPI0012F9FE2B|nr:hypothetical protein [Pseudofrankia sp. DC12]
MPFGPQQLAPGGILGGLPGGIAPNAFGPGAGAFVPFSVQQAVAQQQLQQAALANEIARVATQQQQPFGHLGSFGHQPQPQQAAFAGLMTQPWLHHAVAQQQLQQAALANEIARVATQQQLAQQLQPFGHLGSVLGYQPQLQQAALANEIARCAAQQQLQQAAIAGDIARVAAQQLQLHRQAAFVGDAVNRLQGVVPPGWSAVA